MRYHWGLGVGHFHAHQPSSSGTSVRTSEQPLNPQDVQLLECETEERLGENNIDMAPNHDGDSDVDDPELDLEDREYVGWDDEDLEGGDGDELEGVEEEDFTGL
jgi:hypothetical protein